MPYHPRVLVSRVIPGSVDEVWNAVREFDSIDNWHPVIMDCTVDDGGSPVRIGTVRDFTAGDRTVRERLVAHSDVERYYQYTMEDAEDDAKVDYLAEFRVIPITESDRTLVKWFAHYDVEGGDLGEEAEHLNGVFSAGLDGLQDEFSE